MNPDPGSTSGLTAAVLEAGRAAGLAAVGVAPAEVLEPARTVLQLRKSAGFAGDMQFTYRNPDRSTDPETALSGARSFVAGAWSYGHWQRPESDVPSGPSGSIARYSWHDHYADLEGALQQMADLLIANGYRARVVADTNALVDRNVAWRAGLGWYGKNTNLLIPEAGSWFVLGSVVTDAVLEPSGPPLADGCGPCDRCRDECPTGAIVAPGVIDATRCLAWIVQAPGTIPIAYREAVGDRIYGCDDCQDVCPPNRVTIRGTGQEEGSSLRGETPVAVAEPHRVRADIVWLLEAEDDQILDRHGRWYIPRRDVDHVRRTALVVLGNTAAPRDRSTVPLLRRYLTDPNPMLRAHATWAAKRLGLGRLLPEDHADDDPTVQTEREASVTARFSSADWDGALAVGVRAGP